MDAGIPVEQPHSTREIAFRLALGDWPDRGVRITTEHPIDRGATRLTFLIEMRVETRARAFSLSIPPTDFTRWHGYSLDLYGVAVSNVPDGNGHPYWIFFPAPTSTEPPLPVQLWRMWAQYRNSPVFAEILWIPSDRPRQAIKGPGTRLLDPKECEQARRGLDLFHHIEDVRRKEKTRDDAQKSLVDAVCQLSEEGRKITRTALSERLVVSLSAVDKRLQRAGWSLRDLERMWIERAPRRGL